MLKKKLEKESYKVLVFPLETFKYVQRLSICMMDKKGGIVTILVILIVLVLVAGGFLLIFNNPDGGSQGVDAQINPVVDTPAGTEESLGGEGQLGTEESLPQVDDPALADPALEPDINSDVEIDPLTGLPVNPALV
jgi:hypothetical protein|tara:strand:+ start:743 stop:1150 length:408 start_codon:yes stop_codon:yes gene_type:complete